MIVYCDGSIGLGVGCLVLREGIVIGNVCFCCNKSFVINREHKIKIRLL